MLVLGVLLPLPSGPVEGFWAPLSKELVARDGEYHPNRLNNVLPETDRKSH